MSELDLRLGDALRDRDAVIGVIGLGYVGLPLALAFAESGFRVLGFDLDDKKTEHLNRGETYLDAFPTKRIRPLVDNARLSATTDMERLSEPDALLICVPTPLADDATPDLEYVKETARRISDVLRVGQLVVLESTTYPGTTEEVVLPILEASGLRSGEDFFLAYSPERENPGSTEYRLESIPKVVGGVGRQALSLALTLYESVVPTTVPVSSPRVAEASKLTENIYRAVNIALVNELKMIFDRMDIDVWEVMEAASTKPFGFKAFYPGPGWGGHCIPIDPFYLSWKAREAGAEARFIELAGEINTMMPRFVLAKLEAALEVRGIDLKGARVLLIGLAYKKNVADPRESPAFEFIELLREKEALPAYHDPYIPVAPSMRRWHPPGADVPAPLESVALSKESLAAFEAVVVITDHDSIDWDLIRENARLIVDSRGRFREPAKNVIRA